MSDDGAIDAIAVVYGRGAWTWQAIQALRATAPVRRIFIVDNAADNPGLSHERLAQLPYVEYIPSRNIGVFAANNLALARTQTRYVANLVSDCIYLPGWYEATRWALEHCDLAWASPEWDGHNGFSALPAWSALLATNAHVILGRFSISFALFDWHRLRDCVGWFDADFFCAFGDDDWQQRMDDAGLRYGMVGPTRAIHLNDLSRTSFTAADNVVIESWDDVVFRQKYADRHDVLDRFPSLPSMEVRLDYWRRRGLT